MTTLFISDLHLDEARPEATELFKRFLGGEARRAQRLFVLGDLFEYWVGDDHETRLAGEVADAFSALSATGTDLFFMAGNRDFLLGARYAERCRIRILADPACILLGGRKAVISHGDALCTDDTDYQSFRAQVRDPSWQAEFLARPVEDRLAFARQARDASTASTRSKPTNIMDVNAEAVAALMARLDSDLLIHGHTHRPAVHDLEAGRTRVVLGDWYDQGSALWVEESELDLVALR